MKNNFCYIFRIDDVVPWMNWTNFEKIEKIFDKYWIKPIIWVVPNNEDYSIWNNNYNKSFWTKINCLYSKWWIVAQHWYSHKYVNTNWWILNINKYWEFAWLPYDEQFKKIEEWKRILESNLWIEIKWRMAPAHSFDINTCKVLKNLWFEYITDWIAIYPFIKYWLKRLPQQLWHPSKKYFWTRTICLHTNKYNSDFIKQINNFCKDNHDKILWDFNNIDYHTNFIEKIISFFWSIKLKLFSKLYFYKNKIKSW